MQKNKAYKETPIGKIPIDWEVKTIGDIFELSQGLQISKKLRIPYPKEGYIPLLKITELENRNFSEWVKDIKSNYIATTEDIIYTRTGQVGLVYTDLEGCVHNNCFKVHYDKCKFYKMFVYYMLKQKRIYKYSNNVAGGSVQKDLSHPAFKSCIVTFPSFLEQKVIAQILFGLDSKIKLNCEMNKTLEAMAQAIFKSWFVNFDPVRVKMEGRKPYGMDEETAAKFLNEFEDSEFGEIPKGWEIKPIDKIADFLNGLALQKYPPDGKDFFPVIKIAEMRSGFTKRSGKASINVPTDYIIEDGDILFSWSGSLEVIIWCNGQGALNQHLFKVTSSYYPKWFYYLWLLHHLSDFRAIAAGKATTMGHIKRSHLSEASVVVPPKTIMNTIDQIITPIINNIISNNLESRTLTLIRDTLLPKLISGQIRIKEPEKLLQDRDLNEATT